MSLANNKCDSTTTQKSSEYYYSLNPPPYYLFNQQKNFKKISSKNKNFKNLQNNVKYEENSIFKNFTWHPMPQQFLALLLPLLFSLFALALLIGAVIYLQLLNSTKSTQIASSIKNRGEIGKNQGKTVEDEKQLKRMRRQTVPADNVRVSWV